MIGPSREFLVDKGVVERIGKVTALAVDLPKPKEEKQKRLREFYEAWRLSGGCGNSQKGK